MKLFEHPDFEQAVIRAAEHFRTQGLRESIIEKDYFAADGTNPRQISSAGSEFLHFSVAS
jgi:hypothetical protein